MIIAKGHPLAHQIEVWSGGKKIAGVASVDLIAGIGKMVRRGADGRIAVEFGQIVYDDFMFEKIRLRRETRSTRARERFAALAADMAGKTTVRFEC